MLDIKFIRQNPQIVKEGSKKKQVNVDVDKILELDKEKREYQKKLQNLRAEQNKISKSKIKDSKILKRAKELKVQIKELEKKLKPLETQLNELLYQVPNLPFDDVPVGKDETENVVIKKWGEKPKFDFKFKDYLELAEKLDLIDVKRAAKTSGTRFGFLKREVALLEFALINLVFGTVIPKGFIPIVPPTMIKPEPFRGMGYLERGKEEVYFIPKDNLYLIGTAEQIIGPMHTDEIFREKELPKRYVAFSSCFRREAGSYGKDTRGIFRVHQFDKVEMFSFCKPEDSIKEHHFFLNLEEKLMQRLSIPYRVVQMCTGDLGDPAAAKYDIEAWIPSQERYRETHSTSNCTDFQARRLNIKYRDNNTKKLRFVHTVNGTAFAVGRTIIAILENYQQKDGTILIPKALQKYTGFEKIER